MGLVALAKVMLEVEVNPSSEIVLSLKLTREGGEAGVSKVISM